MEYIHKTAAKRNAREKAKREEAKSYKAKVAKPRKQSALELWYAENQDKILGAFRDQLKVEFGDPAEYSPEVKEQVKKRRAGMMTSFKKAEFAKLSEAERRELEERSVKKLAEDKAARGKVLAELAEKTDGGPCTNPEEIQE